MRRTIFIFLLIGFLAPFSTGCKKDKLEPDQIGETVFTSTFNFDGTDFELTAGINSQSLQTHTSVLNDTVIFASSLDPNTCNNCGPGLYLNLKSEIPASSWSALELDQELPSWQYGFNPDTTFTETLQVITSSESGPGYWLVDNVQQNTEPSANYEFEFQTFDNYDIGFMTETGICGIPATQNITFDGQPVCYGNIVQTPIDPFMFFAIPSGGFNSLTTTYTWILGDSTYTNSGSAFEISPQTQADTLCLEMNDPGGCIQTVCINLALNPGQCANNFLIDSTAINSQFEVEMLSIMELSFIDETGELFSSHIANQSQPSSAYIQLISAEPYTEPSEPTKNLTKVTFEINCTLFNTSGNGFNFIGIVESAFEDPGL